MPGFRLRNYSPRGLGARLAALVAVPVLATFAITTLYYYQQHIRDVNEKLSQSIAREVGLIIAACEINEGVLPAEAAIENQLGLEVDCRHADGMIFPSEARTRFAYASVLREQIAIFVDAPLEVRVLERGTLLDFRSPQAGSAVQIRIDRKRALAANTHFTIVWLLASTLIMLALGFAFLRNQVRSILRLGEAAKAFGRGQDMPEFRPSGATEVREAARAVMEMKQRLTAFTEQRTALLAGVSHDLRTPLTRLKLQLAMMEENEDIAAARDDVSQMSAMLDEYLAFAKGEELEQAEILRLDELVRSVAERFGPAVKLTDLPAAQVNGKRLAITRAISNLVSNAAGFGDKVEVQVLVGPRAVEVIVDDDGPGIASDDREAAFRPFQRLDEARSQNLPGTGLGLALARDTARAHGGDVRLEDSPMGGLRARLRLPK